MNPFYTQEQLVFIADAIKIMPAQQLATVFNIKFGANKTARAIKATCLRHGFKSGRDGRFKKGEMPWNAGTKGQGLTGANIHSFKPGNIPVNNKPLGQERICAKEGYTYIKVTNNQWKLKHQALWEAQNGPVPTGHVVSFIDGNKQNFSLDNLELLSRQELLQLNISNFHAADPALKPIIRTTAKLTAKLYQKQRELNHGCH